MGEFVMPILGADMTTGTLVEWRKKPGDTVSRGDIVAVVETDKGSIEIEIFAGGVIEKLLVEPGKKVPTGSVLALIRELEPSAVTAAGSTGALHGPAAAALPVAARRAPAVAASSLPGRADAPRVRISPLARNIAAQLGIDPATVTGTGPGGAVQREDIERAAAAKTQPPASRPKGAEEERFLKMRQAIAAAMARSKREIPHYYLSTPINLQQAVTWLAEENRKRPVTGRLLVGVLLLKAVALALREVPELNAVWEDGQARIRSAIHVGVAISLRQGGLIAPALHDTDRQPLDELMRRFLDLVKRARAGTLRSSELSDPTITVTSLGEQGVESVFGVVYPPQVAIVGFGKVVERPWSEAGQVVTRPLVSATLSADHRVTDGHRGSRFLSAVERWLQEPGQL